MSVSQAEILTPLELAARYRVTKQTVLQWYHGGVIPAVVAVGKVYRFDPAAVDAALAARAAEENSPMAKLGRGVGVI